MFLRRSAHHAWGISLLSLDSEVVITELDIMRMWKLHLSSLSLFLSLRPNWDGKDTALQMQLLVCTHSEGWYEWRSIVWHRKSEAKLRSFRHCGMVRNKRSSASSTLSSKYKTENLTYNRLCTCFLPLSLLIFLWISSLFSLISYLCSCLLALFFMLASLFCSHLSSSFLSHLSSVCSLLPSSTLSFYLFAPVRIVCHSFRIV